MAEFRVEGQSVFFWLRVRPGAGRERLRRTGSGEICLEVSALPVEGQANEACVRLLARALRLPQACVAILAGHKSRCKLLRITGPSAEETISQLTQCVGRKL